MVTLVLQAAHVHPGLQAADVRAPDRVPPDRIGLQSGLQSPHFQAAMPLVRCPAPSPHLHNLTHPPVKDPCNQ